MSPIIADPFPPRQAARRFALRPEQPTPRTLADIQQDPRYSDRAKRIAEYLDGRCWGDDKWASWPKVSTIAHALGWDASDPRAFRKRIERGLKELIVGGDLARMTLRELVEWHDAEGDSLGLPWPARLPRGMRLSLKVCVLLWRIPGAMGGPPILPRCDTKVASSNPAPTAEPTPSVALPETSKSQGVTSQMSHPSLLKVRRQNQETTTDLAPAREGSGDAVGSSSSSLAREGRGGPSTACLAPEREADEPKPLKAVLDRAMGNAAIPNAAPPVAADDPARAALILKIEEIAPGPDGREARRAIYDAVKAMLSKAEAAGSASPFDHVRMAIDRAAACPHRRESIESYARGVVRIWVDEGFPALVAPAPPGRPKPPPDPEADRRAAVERRRREEAAENARWANIERWKALPESAKESARVEFERTMPRPPAGPLVKLWDVGVRDYWIARTV